MRAVPRSPMLAQGANMAIEDGMVLARCIERDGDDLSAALKRFEKPASAGPPKLCAARPRRRSVFTIQHSRIPRAPRLTLTANGARIKSRPLTARFSSTTRRELKYEIKPDQSASQA